MTCREWGCANCPITVVMKLLLVPSRGPLLAKGQQRSPKTMRRMSHGSGATYCGYRPPAQALSCCLHPDTKHYASLHSHNLSFFNIIKVTLSSLMTRFRWISLAACRRGSICRYLPQLPTRLFLLTNLVLPINFQMRKKNFQSFWMCHGIRHGDFTGHLGCIFVYCWENFFENVIFVWLHLCWNKMCQVMALLIYGWESGWEWEMHSRTYVATWLRKWAQKTATRRWKKRWTEIFFPVLNRLGVV